MRYLNAAHRVAMYCWAAPLALAVAIFMAWLVTRRDWLAIAGLYLVYVGFAAFLIGIVFLARSWRYALRADYSENEVRRRLGVAALLLLTNIPVAVGMILAAEAIAAQYLVVVENMTHETFGDVHVVAGDCDIDWGSVIPSSVSERFFRPTREMYALKFSGVGESMGPIEAVVAVRPSQTTITIHIDGTLTSSDERPITPMELWLSGELNAFDIVTHEVAYWLDRSPCK